MVGPSMILLDPWMPSRIPRISLKGHAGYWVVGEMGGFCFCVIAAV